MAVEEAKPRVGGGYKLEKPVEETILYEKVEPHIARVTLNRPEKHNALYPPDMFEELVRKIEIAVNDDEVKVIILRGAGPSFCTGDDLDRAPYESFGGTPGRKLEQSKRLIGIRNLTEGFFRSIALCPKTIIAQIHGHVIGAGWMIVNMCDLAIAAENTKLARREQRIGFAGMGTSMHELLMIGPKRVRELMLTARTMTAQEAKEWGMVNAVVPDDQLDEEALRWARAVALHSTDGLMIGKYYMWLAYEMMGAGAMNTSWFISHALFTNLAWRDDELNFLKARVTEGSTGEAFRRREKLWADLGFE